MCCTLTQWLLSTELQWLVGMRFGVAMTLEQIDQYIRASREFEARQHPIAVATVE